MENLKIANIKKFLDEARKDHVEAYAAQAAYFITLSFIPFIMLLLSAIKYTPVTKEDVFLMTERVMPEIIAPLAISVLEEIYNKSAAIIPLTVLAAIWSSGKGFMSLTRGLNAVCHVTETRNYLLVRLKSLLYTLIFIGTILLSLVLMVFGKSLEAVLEQKNPVIGTISDFVRDVRVFGVAVLLLVLVVFFALLFKFVPNRKASFREQLPGAVFTAGTWAVFSFCFAVYFEISSGFTYIYGSLTMVIIMMLWLYFCMYLMLIGAEINARLRKDKLSKKK